MLVERTKSLLCPLSLEDMSYSGVSGDDTDSEDDTTSESSSSSSSDDDDSEDVIITIAICMAVAMIAACAFAGMMYTKEMAGEPMFRPLEDMEPEGYAKKQSGPTEVGLTVVSASQL